ncbi:uncharacterized protein Z520_11621 [Fonsecaea multimorphosa CBS 102226]|uniref:CENP-V/GFA domain-containing protein n=1 Tax=Fonsecaea multimorphosa CBS 102226 TaxID=1442371 RepID=A0A0D2JHD2_9EURO|nr:uncharacterized protein Z520_11621 [Fonsecaea multimorphosa CBS 102226]KIX92592.1 hypothetical protein Z520_11621 [Fonsecaea multimorphosa CBS 102226]OAL17899.1 hypothetical protein AYO22_11163 [Fonsecaea multimorphosa]
MAPQGVEFPIEGGCDCGEVRYSMMTEPMIVHCCHCRWCQRETGASFALNAMIETERLKLLKNEPEYITVPSESGAGQSIARCPRCKVAVWSVYLDNPANVKAHIRIVRVGTLDNPDLLPPNAHIWASEKQPWIILSDKVPVYERMDYNEEDVWSKESLERYRAIEAHDDTAQ